MENTTGKNLGIISLVSGICSITSVMLVFSSTLPIIVWFCMGIATSAGGIVTGIISRKIEQNTFESIGISISIISLFAMLFIFMYMGILGLSFEKVLTEVKVF